MASDGLSWFVTALACHQVREGMGDALLGWGAEDWSGGDVIAPVGESLRPHTAAHLRAGGGWWWRLLPGRAAPVGEGG